METFNTIIQILQLSPHPEGGYFRETYRSAGEISPENLDAADTGKRNHSTCIYFLLTSGAFSAFHRIIQDEIWHFYDGSPLHTHLISRQGNYSKVVIGRDLAKGEVPQFVIPGGTWFASEVISPGSYSLIGCTVSPGFDFRDFELAKREELIRSFPQHNEVIRRMTRM
jgi:predicted cupin superfamily sugar epimerase